MLHVKLDPELEKDLAFWAKRNGQTMDDIAAEAIRAKVQELEDIALLEQALAHPEAGNTVSAAEMRRQLGLDA